MQWRGAIGSTALWIACALWFLGPAGYCGSPGGSPAVAASPTAYVRVNQAGYSPGEPKVALALTASDLSGQEFLVVAEADGAAVFEGAVGLDRGAYGSFAHLYELDFSGLSATGLYSIHLGQDSSPRFLIGNDTYASILPSLFRFFRVQRCGDTDPSLHGVCHLKDGIAAGGPHGGESLEATGGWHDAGDYLKFLLCHGFAVNLMLSSYVRHPEAFPDSDGDGIPDVLAEARIGLDWMSKMWDSGGEVLYCQVGDESDHDQWRMPEGDDTERPPRLVHACPTGKGANLAGAAASCFALASVVWGQAGKPWSDQAIAQEWLSRARQLYAYGQANPLPCHYIFYADPDSADEMALGATELFRVTGESAYLADARSYAREAGVVGSFDWASVHGLAQYSLGLLDPSYKAEAASGLADDLGVYVAASAADPWSTAMNAYFWGCNESMAGAALEALWYEDLTGDPTYRPLARAQRDWELGLNPWGVCWINSAGDNWPNHPHHQVADLTGSELVGFWDEGPVPRANWDTFGITLRNPDAYAAFQSAVAVYHDDPEDYVTNEPTITMNAAGIALLSWYAGISSPSVSAVGSPASGPPPLAVAFTASAAGGTPPYVYAWQFGDGSSGAGASQSHTYSAVGSYVAVVTATDSASLSASGEVSITVSAPLPPSVDSLAKLGSPFRIRVQGANFQPGIRILINEAEWDNVVRKSGTALVLKGDGGLKTAVPKNTLTAFRFVNPDGGEATLSWQWP